MLGGGCLVERLARTRPVVLVFEDAQWADAGLLSFVEHVVDWSARLPIFIVTVAQPELAEQHPDWLAGRRQVTPIPVDPLPDSAIGALLEQLVPGLPVAASGRLVSFAQGVPISAELRQRGPPG